MSIYLDGFKIRLSESTSILRPEDAITIRYQCKQEEKEKSKPKAQPTKETMPNPIQQEPTPVVIDNSKNQSEEAGIAIPTNRIIRFDGDEESSVNGIRLDVPSIKGNTGILDLGVAYQPARLTNLQFNHGAKGYVGDREGASVNLIALYAF